jgi:hypothetical protein
MQVMGGLSVVGVLLLLIAPVAIGSSELASNRLLAYGAVLFVIGGLGFVYSWLFLKNSILEVGPGWIGYQDFLGRRKTWPCESVDRVIDLAITYSKRSQRGVYFLGRDGHKLLSINPRAWDRYSIDRLVRACGRPLEQIPEPIDISRLTREFPGLATWWIRNGTLVGGLIPIVAVVVALGGYLLVLEVSTLLSR